jgi:hypothetical protein
VGIWAKFGKNNKNYKKTGMNLGVRNKRSRSLEIVSKLIYVLLKKNVIIKIISSDVQLRTTYKQNTFVSFQKTHFSREAITYLRDFLPPRGE